jgi:EmrB/QacA subfamily drug resistance transporter
MTLSQRQINVAFAALMLAILLAALDQTIVATALPTIAGDFKNINDMAWVFTTYVLASTIGLAVYGKLGDLVGRKLVFESAIIIFLVGSSLCAISQNMGQLIASRAIQGIGGGGLIIGAQAIVGEIIAPRQRARYMGLVGAVFGLASIAGPLVGGFLTDNASWRWCFWINLPIGLLCLAGTITMLPLPRPRGKVNLDVPGVILLTGAVVCIVLFTSWAGTKYSWGSTKILLLGAGAVILSALFLFAERFATDAIVPLRLFRDSVFNVSSAIGFVVGVGMFGAISYLPTYFQMVDGVDATNSGLRMLPMMLGLMVAAIASGRRITATGRYKIYPILGIAVAGGGLALLSLLKLDTPYWLAALYLAVVGIGFGLVMQVLILAVQNSALMKDLGAATSATNFLRQVGGSFGLAVFGSIFTERLTTEIGRRVPAGMRLPDSNAINPALLDRLPSAARKAISEAYAAALPRIYLYLVPLFAVAFVLAFMLKEKELRTGTTADQPDVEAVDADAGQVDDVSSLRRPG